MKRIALIIVAALLMVTLTPSRVIAEQNSEKEVSAFSFILFGDIQVTQSAEHDFAAFGDFAADALRRNPGAAFALQAGDIVESGIDDLQWDAFFAAWKRANEGREDALPLYPTNGNHESNTLSGKPEKYLSYFPDLPQNGPEGFKGEFYSFDYENAHILVVNSWVFSGEQKLTEAQLQSLDAWVEADLAESLAAWKIVLTHVPPIPVHSDTTGYETGKHWLPIFEKYGVSLLLVGHQHVYSRLAPIKNGEPDYTDGITQIMSNSGLKFYDSADETYAERTIYNVTNYQVFTIDGDTLTMQCFDGDGTEIDFVELKPRHTNVTRMEYVETLWRAAGSPKYTQNHPFTDTGKSDALTWAWLTGLIQGYGNGKFGPNDKMKDWHIELVLDRMAANEKEAAA